MSYVNGLTPHIAAISHLFQDETVESCADRSASYSCYRQKERQSTD